LPEEGKPGVLTETTKKRYFYDAEAHGNVEHLRDGFALQLAAAT